MPDSQILVLAGVLVAIELISTIVLKASIRHEYDRKLEELKSEIRRREQAAVVAELLAEWISNPNPDAQHCKTLNRLTWEAKLWLPEALVKDLCRTLVLAPGRKNVIELIVDVRRVLVGKPDSVTAADIIVFTPKN
jgi:hypothetical protein